MTTAAIVKNPVEVEVAGDSPVARAARKLRAAYAITPDAPFLQREFGYYCMERWHEQGLDRKADLDQEFGYEPSAMYSLGGLGWCEAPFAPQFEERQIEDRGDYELVQDKAGRHVLYFKGRRNGFMPEYVAHPVKDLQSWEENCGWRLDPASPERSAAPQDRWTAVREAVDSGCMVSQRVIGGYMYLRSLMGPTETLMAFCEAPDLVHVMMRAWLALADAVIARHQEQITLDELFLAEDICYNRGPLISPEMMREFLFPYYRELIANIKKRQLDRTRRLHIHVDTDGYCDPVIPVYHEIGVDVMSPFEVAAGCDVVRAGQEFPWLIIKGGVDKRVLAESPDAIDQFVDRVFPAMRARGGYVPTCDHGVPEEVSLENYRYYRKRCLEFA